MAFPFLALQLAIDVAFVLLAVRTIASWVQHPDRRHANLAIALVALAVMMLLAPSLGGSGPWAQVVTDAAAAVFLISGYGLLSFRNTFVPFRPTTMRLITAAIVAIGVLDIAVRLPATPDSPHSPLQTLALAATLAIWSFCILEPIVTFWTASQGRPPVESARLRALSSGYAALLLVILIGTLAGSFSDGIQAVIEVVALLIVPVLYVAFFQPVWLRRIWRQPEEDQFRLALHDLLMYSPDRETLADRALMWAERLIGGDASYVVDAGGAVLAARGVTRDEALAMSEQPEMRGPDGKSNGQAPWRSGKTVVVPLDVARGRGALAIVTGRLSPMFGDDEIGRLQQYAASITAGLDRVTLNEKIAALERAKTEFLSVASHELRGPMTVIKGYLTMLDAGALGELAPKAQSVLPLLISKSDEINWMVEQMIEASRLEEGRLALKRHRADIVELTESAADGLRLLLSGHEVNVDSPRQPIDADVDPDRFQIVVRNLLSNAAKYSPAGTEIDIAVRRDGDKAFVIVADKGVGISKEDQKNLFTRFGRIDTDVHVQGTGLGLWLSREIARMHDGDLTVQSETGAGSTFTFSVPLSK